MREFIYDGWNGIMNANSNPLKNIPDTNVRHMVMQVLAWMWCIVFAFIVGDLFVFGISAVAHVLLIAAIVITVTTFETAKRNPKAFNFSFHTPSRSRQVMYLSGKDGKLEKIKLPANDPGGEHE